MFKIGCREILVLAFSSGVSMLSAATPAIGVAVSQGNIVIDSAVTAGNATIFDGNTIQTSKMASQVRLKDGGQVRLASDSRGKVFSDHVDLQQGSAQVSGYAAVANGLSIRPEGTGSAAISIQGKVVQVAALTANVHVFNANGVNVANLVPGRALNLAPQDAGASAPSSLTGCAVRSNNTLLFTDENSNVTVQLRGGNVRTNRRVTVTGAVAANATPVSGASQVIDVSSVKEIGGRCKTPAEIAAGAGAAGAGAAAGAAGGAAAGAGAAGAAAGAAGAAAAGVAGISATTAVIAGVAAAAAAGTAVAAGTSGATTSAGSSSTP